jgi:hypothetical protein
MEVTYDPDILEVVKTFEPEDAARMVRALCRAGCQEKEKELLLGLLARAVHSTNRGESASMERYLTAVLEGRRIKYSTFEIDFETGETDDA